MTVVVSLIGEIGDKRSSVKATSDLWNLFLDKMRLLTIVFEIHKKLAYMKPFLKAVVTNADVFET